MSKADLFNYTNNSGHWISVNREYSMLLFFLLANYELVIIIDIFFVCQILQEKKMTAILAKN